MAVVIESVSPMARSVSKILDPNHHHKNRQRQGPLQLPIQSEPSILVNKNGVGNAGLRS